MIDDPTHYQLAEYIAAVKEVGALKAERDQLRQRLALFDKMEAALVNAERELCYIVHGAGRKGGLYEKALNECRAVLAEAKRLKGKP